MHTWEKKKHLRFIICFPTPPLESRKRKAQSMLKEENSKNKTEINEIENRKAVGKISEAKSWFWKI